jgi:hypothetical protein
MWRVMYAAGTPADVAEGEAGFRNGRIVQDRHESGSDLT